MMQVHFAGTNIDITPALKEFTAEKLKTLEKKFSHVTIANVVFHIENITQVAEITIHINGNEMHASAKTDDMYKSIEEMMEKLTGQLNKYKEKLIDSHR